MRIALVMERIESARGGAETSTLQFARHLLDLGIEVELFTLSSPAVASEIKVHSIDVDGSTRTRRSAAFVHEVDRLTGAGSFDVVHAISPCRQADVYEPRGGTVVETMARNLALRRTAAARFVKRLANRFNRRQRLMLELERQLLGGDRKPFVLALSDYVVRQLRAHYDFPESHIRKVFNGVDPDESSDADRARDRREIRSRYGIADDELLVLLVAHNFKLKGVGRWIEAAARLVQAGQVNLRSLVVGRGDSARWRRMAASVGAADRVLFAGPTDRVSAFYHAADLLVHPTYYDPCSRVVLEALAAGLPAITTRYDGAAEAIEDGVNGWVLASPEDVEGLAERVSRLADPQHRQEMGRHAEQAGRKASMRRHAEQVATVYEEVARRRTVQ